LIRAQISLSAAASGAVYHAAISAVIASFFG
jgi:hypothetical protein